MTIAGNSNQTTLFQRRQNHLRLLDGLLVCLDLGVCLIQLALQLLFALLVLFFAILILGNQTL